MLKLKGPFCADIRCSNQTGNDIRHATSDFFFIEWLYATQTFPRDPSFFSNSDIMAILLIEIKQHVAINRSYYLLLKRITLSRMLICKLFGNFQQSYSFGIKLLKFSGGLSKINC